MQKQILATGFFLLSFIFPLRASAQNFEEIYVFGDSISDVGNLFDATGGDVPPSPPYFEGRFSNGPIWVEYLALDLGLTPNPNTNFAFGGATTWSSNTIAPGSPGLQQQINGFTTANPSANPNALYIVWAGGNDYLGGGVTDPTMTLNNLSTAVTSLAAVGATNIMVVNLLDLGMLPGPRVDSQISNALSALTEAHNSGLAATLDVLSRTPEPDINIIPLDVNSLFNEAIAAPERFGFTNVTDSCLAQFDVCNNNPDKFLFWDDYHPTTASHQLVGELAFSALREHAPVPEPVPEPASALGVLAFGALGAGLVLKKLWC